MSFDILITYVIADLAMGCIPTMVVNPQEWKRKWSQKWKEIFTQFPI